MIFVFFFANRQAASVVEHTPGGYTEAISQIDDVAAARWKRALHPASSPSLSLSLTRSLSIYLSLSLSVLPLVCLQSAPYVRFHACCVIFMWKTLTRAAPNRTVDATEWTLFYYERENFSPSITCACAVVCYFYSLMLTRLKTIWLNTFVRRSACVRHVDRRAKEPSSESANRTDLLRFCLISKEVSS